MILPLYTVQRVRKTSNDRYGLVHWAHNDQTTLCDKEIDDGWWILTTDHDGAATCKKCKKIFNEAG
jgi:tRNA G18 (ribose-2'-O)-methylase SpoU